MCCERVLEAAFKSTTYLGKNPKTPGDIGFHIFGIMMIYWNQDFKNPG